MELQISLVCHKNGFIDLLFNAKPSGKLTTVRLSWDLTALFVLMWNSAKD